MFIVMCLKRLFVFMSPLSWSGPVERNPNVFVIKANQCPISTQIKSLNEEKGSDKSSYRNHTAIFTLSQDIPVYLCGCETEWASMSWKEHLRKSIIIICLIWFKCIYFFRIRTWYYFFSRYHGMVNTCCPKFELINFSYCLECSTNVWEVFFYWESSASLKVIFVHGHR